MLLQIQMPTELTYNEPLVSVLVPIYNSAPYLKECIDSILSQSYKNLQIVLVDDGSTDSSSDICLRYEIADPRIEFHRIQHSGISVVRNQLLDLAKGKYSIFIDSDDYYNDSSCLKRLVEFAENNDLDVSMFCSSCSDESGGTKILNRAQSIETFVKDVWIQSSMWTKLVRTSSWTNLKFDVDIECGEDVLMTWNLLNKIDRIGIIEGDFYYYRNNPNSITSGHFSDRIYSMHLVWDKIVDNCHQQFPELESLAIQKQMQCYEGLLCLAVKSRINSDSRISNIRNNIRRNIHLLFAKGKSIKYVSFMLLSTYFYDMTRTLFSRYISHINTIR